MDWEKKEVEGQEEPRQSGFVPLTPGQAFKAGPDDAAPAAAASSSKKRAVLVVVLVLLLVGAGLAVWWAWSHAGDGALPTDPNVKVGSVTGGTEDLDKIVDEGMLTFSINSTPVFEDGTANGNLMIENSEINNNRFTVAIVRDDTGETIYQSGALDPGQYIDDVPLDADLPAGEYACTATFSTYRLSDNSPIGQAAAGLTITVLN